MVGSGRLAGAVARRWLGIGYPEAAATQCGSSPFARNNSRNVVNNPLTGLKKLLTLSELSCAGGLVDSAAQVRPGDGNAQKILRAADFDVYANVNILYIA
jgi:hypothetical protein